MGLKILGRRMLGGGNLVSNDKSFGKAHFVERLTSWEGSIVLQLEKLMLCMGT